MAKRQQARLDAMFADPKHADVWRVWRVYQQVVAAYREKFSGNGGRRLRELIDLLKATTPVWFVEFRKLGYTLDRRRQDILAYFDHPRTSNGPTEAINGRLEHLRGFALGFRNPTNYIARSLLESGGFRPLLHPINTKSPFTPARNPTRYVDPAPSENQRVLVLLAYGAVLPD